MENVTTGSRRALPAFALADLWPVVAKLADDVGAKLAEFNAPPTGNRVGTALRAEDLASEVSAVADLLRLYATACRAGHLSGQVRFVIDPPAAPDPFLGLDDPDV